ncbi:hypothetical protein GSI_05546 [Ganoderma sinense ZZ0214-1]|uniref:Uncharacterized protein n=1 Tax=Ganoderma sinense ZZ0214-1 TaxID=1077348 RepID=A0A2G8SEX6_9APHY|nr:hypothetical protein GSI_05546 [Ganoderma sinense ZZ0214-1]
MKTSGREGRSKGKGKERRGDARMATLLLGSLMAPKTAELPDETHVHAPVQEVPSTRMSCDVAPAARTPFTPACMRLNTVAAGMPFGSFWRSKMTCESDTNSAASCCHQDWNLCRMRGEVRERMTRWGGRDTYVLVLEIAAPL